MSTSLKSKSLHVLLGGISIFVCTILIFAAITDFGASSLDFKLSCYASDITSRASISTDLRERILARFREHNIEIPFPQQDIHVIGPVEMKK